MMVPRLHVVTDDAVLGGRGFESTARTLLARGGPALALHVRGHSTPAARLFAHAHALRGDAAAAGAWLVVNDRVDVALAVGAAAVQLGRRSVPLEAARELLRGVAIGYSAHGADEAAAAAAAGTDFVLLGTIFTSPSHAGRAPLGAEAVAAAAGCGVPVLAIGGITPARVAAVADAGAAGVAVLSGVWHAAAPAAALADYLAALALAFE